MKLSSKTKKKTNSVAQVGVDRNECLIENGLNVFKWTFEAGSLNIACWQRDKVRRTGFTPRFIVLCVQDRLQHCF